VLADRSRLVLQAGGRLLGPSPEFIQLTSDKHRTAEFLIERRIAAAPGRPLEVGTALPLDFLFPAVLKPRDGCGSQGVQLVADWHAAARLGIVDIPSRLEPLLRGTPISVSFLCGPGFQHALPPCHQTLSDDGRFTYLGGSLPVATELASRAQRLATQALAALPAACGYVGLDLVLGESPDGSQDYVIEVNPRLTTSYVGLRAACRDNLAEAMLQAARSHRPSLAFHTTATEFSAAGHVRQERSPVLDT
jgi:predicted ATP-grasp superfamily ATP-dependent carboligase